MEVLYVRDTDTHAAGVGPRHRRLSAPPHSGGGGGGGVGGADLGGDVVGGAAGGGEELRAAVLGADGREAEVRDPEAVLRVQQQVLGSPAQGRPREEMLIELW